MTIRELVSRRSKGRCELCGRPADGQHHRRRRNIPPADCPCNLIDTCTDCHTAAPGAIHRNPRRSRELGLIVSSYVAGHITSPILLGEQWWLLDCGGEIRPWTGG